MSERPLEGPELDALMAQKRAGLLHCHSCGKRLGATERTGSQWTDEDELAIFCETCVRTKLGGTVRRGDPIASVDLVDTDSGETERLWHDEAQSRAGRIADDLDDPWRK